MLFLRKDESGHHSRVNAATSISKIPKILTYCPVDLVGRLRILGGNPTLFNFRYGGHAEKYFHFVYNIVTKFV